MLWGTPQLLVDVTDGQEKLTEEVLFCVSHLLPSLVSDWCQWLKRGKLQDTSYLQPGLGGADEGLWQTLVSACPCPRGPCWHVPRLSSQGSSYSLAHTR